MHIGMVGLGRMGAGMARRLMDKGLSCVVYDPQEDAVARLVADGAVGAASLAELVERLPRPRAVWLMVPASLVDGVLDQLAPQLDADDVVIDGGNSCYHDDIRRAKALADRGVHYLDVGTSGGVHGQARGYCLMIGGDAAAVGRLDPVFAALAPGRDAAPPTPGRGNGNGNSNGAGTDTSTGTGTAEHGYLHCGPAGAGHFVKMVHNGIEYGIMQAYAEGFNLLRHANVGKGSHAADAETAPMRDPQLYQYDMDLPEIAELWRRGSVIGSWLLDLTARAFQADPGLDGYAGRVSDSGEGRWTLHAAIDEGVPVPVLSAALFERFQSRGNAEFANKVLSAMRKGFGGHEEPRTEINHPS
ncbi:6-phosphogluconate dehydrogenase, decarboxylating [Castellaniella defragrans 65Phen]|uniref:6-phosphogluconate dehydrogenase, decarboxylating n=1 Tax=Castellaniella defragrans (strain DSM 12143 / CCUG 39792 / 65Phen) TaxID=1437824 RepID=W8WV48_CASD6|nr:decarboxylating 6-phosphogluconate dehydrogenase [Castellaniella defragrans]CDM23434.1 6-phosphogluconate dehydrogenase, decarboxylating [Castellaniella defragrans 65Phen]